MPFLDLTFGVGTRGDYCFFYFFMTGLFKFHKRKMCSRSFTHKNKKKIMIKILKKKLKKKCNSRDLNIYEKN